MNVAYIACCFEPSLYGIDDEPTFYFLQDGELSTNTSGVKLFETYETALDYAEKHKPEDSWIAFTACCYVRTTDYNQEVRAYIFV